METFALKTLKLHKLSTNDHHIIINNCCLNIMIQEILFEIIFSNIFRSGISFVTPSFSCDLDDLDIQWHHWAIISKSSIRLVRLMIWMRIFSFAELSGSVPVLRSLAIASAKWNYFLIKNWRFSKVIIITIHRRWTKLQMQ
jgi:hypothetical protein